MAKSLETIRFILGEDRFLKITVTDDDGADLSASNATVGIVDSVGTTVLSPASMSGAGSTSRVFSLLLQTGSAQTITAAGRYVVTYYIANGSEIIEFEQTLVVLSPNASQQGYDIGTSVGQVRFWIPDVGTLSGDPQELIDTRYQDSEIQYFITKAGTYEDGTDRIYLACALALEQWANELAQVASVEKISIFSEDTYKTYLAMADRAKYMRSMDATSVDSTGVTGLIAISVVQERFPRFNTDLQTTNPLDQW